MADAKITSLGALSADPADNDVFVIVDVSDTSMASTGTDKKLAASYLMKASGASAGATSQAQTFTNGIIGPSWKPTTNSTTAPQIQDASGSSILTVDTTNKNVIINPAGTNSKGLIVGNGTMPSLTSLYIVNAFPTVAMKVQRASGSATFDVFNLTAENTTGSLSSQIAALGLYVDMNTSPTIPSLRYMYLSSLVSPAFNNANLFMLPSGYVGVGTGNSTPTAWLDLVASTTAAASLRIRGGVAPTSPNTGDIWYTGSLLYRDGSASRTVATTDSAQALSNKTFTQINATSSAGLTLADDAGNLGIFIADGGKVTVGNEFTVESSAGKGLQVNPDFYGICYFFAYDTPGTTHIPFIIRANTLDLQTGTASTTSRLTISATGEIRGNYDTDNAAFFGRARIGYDGSTTDWASFSHIDQTGGANFALMHTPAAATWLNAASGQNIYFAIGGSPKGLWDSSGNHTPYADNVSDSGISGKRWNDIWASNATIQTSDERDKVAIQPSSLGLGFIKALRPVSWVWADIDKPAITEKRQGPDGEYDHILTPAIKTRYKRPHYGFIAQQVKQAMEAVGVDDFAGYIYDQETDGYSLRYNEFMAPMVKALQEINERLERIEQTYYGD